MNELSCPLSLQSISFRLGSLSSLNLQDIWDIGKSPTSSVSLNSHGHSLSKSTSSPPESSPAFFEGLRLKLDTLREYRVDLMRVREVHIQIVVGVTLVAIYTEESRGSALLEVLAHDLD